MPASKGVVIGLSVSGAVALAVLTTILIILYAPKPAAPGGGADAKRKECGDAPVVNTATGEVSNYTNVKLANGSCGEDVQALRELCLQTWCTSPSIPACSPPARASWSDYDAREHRCVIVPAPTCEQQLCDAAYCTSDSIQHVLPPIHKLLTASGNCVNPSETEVAARCNAVPDHQYTFPVCRPVTMQRALDVKVARASTSQVEGTVCFQGDAASVVDVVFFQLEGAADVYTGPVLLAPADKGCALFTIELLPAARAGQYSLTLQGKPSWETVFTTQSTEPVVLDLADDVPTDPSVSVQLNPHPSRELAKELVSDAQTLQLLLSAATAGLPGAQVPSTLTAADARVMPPSGDMGAGTEQTTMVLACAPPVCPLAGGETKLMKHAVVLIAWPLVAGVQGGVVKYSITKRTVTDAALHPVQLPSATVIADLVTVGEVVVYTIIAHSGGLRSQPVTVVLFVPPFPDSICHSVNMDVGVNVKPPWMWQSSGGCVWYPEHQPAQDYYCLFEQDGAQPQLIDGNNKCQPLLPSQPDVQLWASEYCDSADSSANSKAACFTGLSDPKVRTATCSPAIRLGDGGATLSNEQALMDRLNAVIKFYNAHNTHSKASTAAWDTWAKQSALYKSLAKCGPRDDPMWGVLASQCPSNDAQCRQAAENARCGTGPSDRNLCDPWTRVQGNADVYQQTRTCYASPTFTNVSCCQSGQKYVFDNQAPSGAPRGKCE